MSNTTTIGARMLRLLLTFAVALSGAIGLATVNAAPAQALCSTPAMMGNWTNIDSGTRSLTRVNVGFYCSDQILCDTNGNCTGGQSYFTLRAFGKCTPTDCDWGTRRASDMGGGWQRAIWTHS